MQGSSRRHSVLDRFATRVRGDAESRSFRRQVLRLALPSIGEQLLNMSVQLVNTYLVGHLSAAALTAVGLSNTMLMLAQTFVMALATGTTALVARLSGAGDMKGASRAAQQSLVLGAGVGTLLALVLTLFSGEAIAFYRPSEEVAQIGQVYLRIASLSFTLQGVMLVGNAALRGVGDTRTPLYVMLLVNGVNVLISYSLLTGVGSIPSLGVIGPAVGAATSRAIGGIAVVVVLAVGRAGLCLRRKHWRFDLPTVRRILHVGLPAGGEQVIMRVGQTMFSRVVAGLGDVAYAAHQVAITGQSMSFMPGFGFSVAATTLVGQSLGAKDPDRARRIVKQTLLMAATMMGLLGLVLVVLAPQVMALFMPDPAVVARGVGPNRLLGVLQPVLAIMMVYSGALRGAGDTRWTLVITGLAVWLVRLPLAALLTGPLGIGLMGAWIAMSFDMASRAMLFHFRFRSGRWATVKV